jgi:hypothetical protein
LFRYRFETPKQTKIFYFGFTKQTETNAKQILFWLVSVRTEIYFCLFRGHPMCDRACQRTYMLSLSESNEVHLKARKKGDRHWYRSDRQS